jgi:hypothetical protein
VELIGQGVADEAGASSDDYSFGHGVGFWKGNRKTVGWVSIRSALLFKTFFCTCVRAQIVDCV